MQAIQTILGLLQDQTFASTYKNLINLTYSEDGLLLLNYTELCQRRNLWDEVTRCCRGLIVNPQTKEVVAYPFPKFFNWNEYHERLPDEPFTVTEKMDGSLGILYRARGELRLATRGSFTSPEAKQGTTLLQKLTSLHKLPTHWTLLFEIILPKQGAHIVQYNQEALVLLGGFDRLRGTELPSELIAEWANRLGCQLAPQRAFATIEQVLAQRALIPATQEGFVVRFASGLRLKIKGEAYLSALKKSLGISRNKVLEVLCKGEAAYAAFVRKTPEETRDDIARIGEELKQSARALEREATSALTSAPNPKHRAEFARWVEQQAPQLRAPLTDLGNGKEPKWFRHLSER